MVLRGGLFLAAVLLTLRPAVSTAAAIHFPKNPHPKGPIPLVVVLHGCHQDARTIDGITRFSQLADRVGFAVMFPEQNPMWNAERCWNWFLPFHQARGTGEPAWIAGAVRDAVARFRFDPSRVYVVGLSAGAAMANILASCYSELFAAVALHSGLEYLAAFNVFEAENALRIGGGLSAEQSARAAFACSGAVGRRMPAIVVHGSEDRRVAFVNADQVFDQYLIYNDLADDGLKNGSFPYGSRRVREGAVPGGRAYRIEDAEIAGAAIVSRITVFGMAHAWSGGAPITPNGDPAGPDATSAIWDFFSRFSRAR